MARIDEVVIRITEVPEVKEKIGELLDELDRLRNLVNEHHNVRHWINGTPRQRRVGEALWGTPCAVCYELGGVNRTVE